MRISDWSSDVCSSDLPSYLQEHGRPNSPEDLAQHNCLSFGNQGNQARGWLLKQDGELRDVRVKGNMACSDGSVLHQWTLAGIGLAWRSLWEIQDESAAGRLICGERKRVW